MTAEALKLLTTISDLGKKITLKATTDELKLFMEIVPDETQATFVVTVESLTKAIEGHIHTSLLDLIVLQDAVRLTNAGEPCPERRIAKGREAVGGRDGKIVWLVKSFTKKATAVTDDRGFTDFSRAHHFDNVATDQPIARIYPPHDGEDGITVLGNPIRAKPGNSAKVLLDASVSLLDPVDGTAFHTLQAEIDGYVVVDSTTNKISVKPTYEISSDLDLKVGSIDFIGGVVVGGDVHQGITVKARGDIVIKGGLQGGNVITGFKQVMVKGTHFGGDGGSLTARDGYSVKIARRVTADVDGSITIEREAFDCAMNTRTSILAGHAKISGGEYRLVQGGEFGVLGNNAGNKTEVILCTEAEAGREYSDLQKSLELHDQGIHVLLLHLGNYAHQTLKIKNLPSPHREKMEKLQKQLEKLQTSLVYQKNKLKDLLALPANSLPHAKIQIIEMFFPGAIIRCGDAIFKTDEPICGPFKIQYNETTKTLDKGNYEKR